MWKKLPKVCVKVTILPPDDIAGLKKAIGTGTGFVSKAGRCHKMAGRLSSSMVGGAAVGRYRKTDGVIPAGGIASEVRRAGHVLIRAIIFVVDQGIDGLPVQGIRGGKPLVKAVQRWILQRGRGHDDLAIVLERIQAGACKTSVNVMRGDQLDIPLP